MCEGFFILSSVLGHGSYYYWSLAFLNSEVLSKVSPFRLGQNSISQLFPTSGHLHPAISPEAATLLGLTEPACTVLYADGADSHRSLGVPLIECARYLWACLWGRASSHLPRFWKATHVHTVFPLHSWTLLSASTLWNCPAPSAPTVQNVSSGRKPGQPGSSPYLFLISKDHSLCCLLSSAENSCVIYFVPWFYQCTAPSGCWPVVPVVLL